MAHVDSTSARPPLSLRLARVADAAALARVRMDTWRSAYTGIIAEETINAMDFEQESDRWLERLHNPLPESRCWVAEVDTRVVGYCVGGPERDVHPAGGEIYALYVLPAEQGHGIGRALLSTAAADLSERGFKRMMIWVLRDNHPARRFYEAQGGKLADERTFSIRGQDLPEVAYAYDLGETQPLDG